MKMNRNNMNPRWRMVPPHCSYRAWENVRSCVPSHFSHVQLCLTLRTAARQAPLFMEFSRQEYWSGLPCPPPGDLPHPGIKITSLMSLALKGRFFITSATWEAHVRNCLVPFCVLRVLDTSMWFTKPTAQTPEKGGENIHLDSFGF